MVHMTMPFEQHVVIHGHVATIEWLHSVGGVNIHINNEDAFRSTSKYGHLIVI
jgi:hypothetical protein